MLHVAGIGATTVKAELILTVRTLDVIAHYRFSPNLTALRAFLNFNACDSLFNFVLEGFFSFTLNVLGANMVHILEMNFACCTVTLPTKLAIQLILKFATIDTFAVFSQARIESSCPQIVFISLFTEVRR